MHFDISRDEFDLGIQRATKALTYDPSKKPTIVDAVFGDGTEPFTYDDVDYAARLHEYAQWYELGGAVLMQFIRHVEPLTTESFIT